jgi:hypothetical protein
MQDGLEQSCLSYRPLQRDFKEGSHLSGLEFMRKVSASTHNQANITLTPSAQDYFHAS